MKGFKLIPKYVLISLLAVVLTYFFHELFHWLAGECLGYKMKMTFNSVTFYEGQKVSKWEENIVSAAGPVFTLIQATGVYIAMKRSNNLFLYPFLFGTLYMRVLAGVLNLINLNDEGRISKFLGLGVFSISIVVCVFLFILVRRMAKDKGYTARFQLINTLLTMVFSSLLILSDQAFHLKIIN